MPHARSQKRKKTTKRVLALPDLDRRRPIAALLSTIAEVATGL
jgi:hypothetical protein